jgi:chorismate mutase
MADIDHWRKKIDEINLKLLELLNERSRCAIEIGKIKQRQNLEVYDPKREQQIVEQVQALTRGPLTKEAIRRLFERIIDESRRAERESNNHESVQRQAERSERSEE